NAYRQRYRFLAVRRRASHGADGRWGLFAVERGALLSQGVASAGSPSAVEQNTRAVVVMVAVSAAGPFVLFDRGVRVFGLGVGHPCFDERFDLRPAGADRFG